MFWQTRPGHVFFLIVRFQTMRFYTEIKQLSYDDLLNGELLILYGHQQYDCEHGNRVYGHVLNNLVEMFFS